MYNGTYTQSATEQLLQYLYENWGQDATQAAANAASFNNTMSFLLTLGSSLQANWGQIVEAFQAMQGLSSGTLELVGVGGSALQVQLASLIAEATPLVQAIVEAAVQPAVVGVVTIVQMSTGGGPSQQGAGNPLGQGTGTRGTANASGIGDIPKNGKLNAPNAADPELQDIYRNLWRPQDTRPGGTIGELLREAQAGGSLKHLPKAKDRLTQLIRRIKDSTRPLSSADRAGAERVINDLKDAIRIAEGP